MNVQGIKYLGTFTDMSGYGEANRMFITALYQSGLDVTTELIVQQGERADNGWTGHLAEALQNRNIPYKIKIIHLTPDIYHKYMEADKYHIGHLFWETNKLPKGWAEACNKMGEIWTSSEQMADVFRACGVKVPIYAFPQPIDTTRADINYGRYAIPAHEGFMFYSIFQWIERKNPKALLQAYWEAFTGRKDVSLLLKTYRVNFSREDFMHIEENIIRWKKELRLHHYPRVLLIRRLLSRKEIMKIHQTGDCFISADHGEGWNRCLMEALQMGKTVISTARGGIHEYLNMDYYFPIPSTYVPVVEQSWIPYYTEDQKWAEINKEKLKEAMRYVFLNREMANAKGILAKDYIKETFGFKRVGEMMKARIEKIYQGL